MSFIIYVWCLLLACAALAWAGPPPPSSPCPPCGRCRCCSVPLGWGPLLGSADLTPQPALVLNCTRGTGRTAGSITGQVYPDTWSYGRLPTPRPQVWASFRLNELTAVRQLELDDVTQLDLSDNAIRTVHVSAFAGVRRLRRLSLARNDITELDLKVFSGLKALEFLDLSDNRLATLGVAAFSAVTSLRAFNLSGNVVSRLQPGVLSDFAPNLQTLDVSRNALKGLEADAFFGLEVLERLSLAANLLQTLPLEALQPLLALQVLDVSDNALAGDSGGPPASASASASVTEVRAARNRLSDVRALLDAFPGVATLLLSGNRITNLDGADLDSLQELDVSGNPLGALPAELSAHALRRLDLSDCPLGVVPAQLTGARLPKLEELHMNGCRLNAAAFPPGAAFPRLRRLSLSRMPQLQEVSERAFAGLVEGGECVELRLSDNPLLSNVHPAAFQGQPLCALDLSGNALESVAESTANWTALAWADLQRNPWACACSLQWLVDVVVTHLYGTPHAHLLYELRCSTPSALRGRRLVHFFNQSRPALCEAPSARMEAPGAGADDGVHQSLLGSGAALGVIIGLCVLLLLLVAAGVAYTWRRRRIARSRNRRF